ncbi:hypothetical protein Acr_00g0034830 [Actinidia rufa]|uniref:Regulator of Vps4 activity in the MVB pathway protein n=1 Tax=Actinidia rufa TaxID=165716 RepID=A0A7J0DHZ5_9ERIC|nr:hypothetical protein Acr_00g0034830 [Actinidia rufa]
MFSKSLIKRARIQLLIQRNRREAIVRQSRDDIAQLLINGQLDDALARVDQLHNDQCVLSAYDQIEDFCDCVNTNLRGLDRQSKLSGEVSEAVSSLVFAASRCGELSVLHRMRMLFRKHLGDEFDRNSVELLPGNFVNSQIEYSLGDNSVPDDVKLPLITKIAKEYTLCLEANQINEQNLVPQCRQVESVCEPRKKDDESVGSRFGDIRHMNSNYEMQVSKMKDMFWRIGLKFSIPNSRDLVAFRFNSQDSSSNRSRSECSPPIKQTDIKYLDNVDNRSSTNGEDLSGKHKANGSHSLNRSLSSKRFVKKNLTPRRPTMIKKGAMHRKHDGLLHENRRNHQNMLSREGLSMRDSNSERRLVTSSFSDKKKEENEDDKPRLSYVHPKLPDYDELVATFTAYKKEYRKSNSNNRNLGKWMRQ